MTGIPARKKRRIWERKAVVEGAGTVPPIIVTAVSGTINLFKPETHGLGLVLIGAAGWLLIASLIKILGAYAQDKEQKRQDDYEGLQGALYTLYGVAVSSVEMSGGSAAGLRATLHRVEIPEKKGVPPETLEQLLPYVGGMGGPAGRTFSVRSGIVGKAVREKTTIAASRQSEDYQEYLADLVRDWAYTEEEARSLTSDRWSWLAVPIFGTDSRTVLAVAYLDSSERDLFTKEVRELVYGACQGIAAYIAEVY
jgi:hypothetical protein